MTPSFEVTSALTTLRDAADRIRTPWLPASWERVDGPGPDQVSMVESGFIDRRIGAFQPLVVESGRTTLLRTRLDLPEKIGGVELTGDRLDVCVHTIFPTRLSVDGRVVLDDELPVVATGPALVELASDLSVGDNGELEIAFRGPDNVVVVPWGYLEFSTPSTRRRFEQLDVAWAQMHMAVALARSGGDLEAVERAAKLVPAEPLQLGELALVAALEQVAAELESLADRARALTVHLVGHSHIDLAWMWTWADAREVVLRDVRAAVELMDEFPEMTITHSQPAGYQVVRDEQPELFARVRELVAEGRWEPATMQWVECDTNIPAGESHARQLLEGVRFTRAQLGVQPRVLLAPDTFGHAGNLPQLAVSAGARVYYHHRGNPGSAAGEAQLPAYWWEGDDGTRILAVSTPIYNGEITAGALARAAVAAGMGHGHEVSLYLHGVGDHGGGPTRLGLQALRRLQDIPLLPTARCSTIEAYADALLATDVTLPVHRGESSTIFEGCYTTHADSKRYNRRAENVLSTAEALGTLAGSIGGEGLAPEWRQALFHQFHDILDGSSIPEVYEDQRRDHDEVSAVAHAAIDRALDLLEAHVESGEIAVTNPLGFDRTDVVTVVGGDALAAGSGPIWLAAADGTRVPAQRGPEGLMFVATVPAFATVAYRVHGQGDVAGDVTVGQPTSASTLGPAWGPLNGERFLRVETSHFVALVRRDCGVITWLMDKRAGRQLVGWGLRRGSDYVDEARPDLGLNVLQLLDERPHAMTAWAMSEVEREQSLIAGAETEVIEVGPVRAVLETRHKIRSSTIVQRLVFYRDLPRIDVQLDVDWQERGSAEAGIPNLKVACTPSLESVEAWFESPYAAVRRPANGQEVPALRWADVGGPDYGFAIVNDDKHGYDALGPRLRLSLLRTSYDPDPCSDVGDHRIRYSLVPHAGDWRAAGVVDTAAGFNQPLLARVARAAGEGAGHHIHRWPVLRPSSSVSIGTLKPAADGDARVARLYETSGVAATVQLEGVPVGWAVFDADVVEDRGREIPRSGGETSVAIRFEPWQVRTLVFQPQ